MTFVRTLAGLVLAGLAGCGWRAGLEQPAGAETLAIEFLANETKLPDLEIELSRALSRAAVDRLSLVPARPSEADLVVRGRILDLSRRGGIRSPDNVLLESGDRILIETELVRASDGGVLGRSSRWLEAGFVVETGFSAASTPSEAVARRRVVENLAVGALLDLFGRPVEAGPEP